MTSDLGRKDHLGQLAVTCRNFRKPTNYCQLAREGAAEGSQGNIGAIKFWGKFKLWTRKFWASIRRWSNGLEKEADPQINKQWGISSDTEQPWDKVGFPTPISKRLIISSVQFSSVAQSCQTICDPINRSTPGLPVHHQLPFTQTHVHWVSDAIQPSHPLSSPSSPAPTPTICFLNTHQRFICLQILPPTFILAGLNGSLLLEIQKVLIESLFHSHPNTS